MIRTALLCSLLVLYWHFPSFGDRPVSFEVDVETVLSKAGCNSGACHGNQNGKGGFRLSLRGQDPVFDYHALVDQHGGRRINLLDPENSLMLRKPTLQVAHQGGHVLEKGSELYQMLVDWLVAGRPSPKQQGPLVTDLTISPSDSTYFDQDQLQLFVEAKFADGTVEDVTSLAVYETSNLNAAVSSGGLVTRLADGETTVVVRYLNHQVAVPIAFLDKQPDFKWNAPNPRNYVDVYILEKLRAFRTNPASECEDHVFLRRAYLDILGIPPTAAQAKRFAANPGLNKRDELIDELLARPEFADYWALKWADLLRVEEKVLDTSGVDAFHGWIRDSIASGKGLDQFIREIVGGTGSTYENPPANFYRALRKVNQRGEAAARVFLGTRLQCAQCHNHPFDRWTQADYYNWAALFARIDYKIVENNRDDRLDKNQFKGEQIVQIKRAGEVTNPTTGETAPPRFLGSADELDGHASRLDQLAGWLTADENVQFSRAQVNRLWLHLMGRGLVEPVDDFRVTNPASHPKLLEALARDFVAHDFDIRHILRTIMRSRAYGFGMDSECDERNFGSVAARRLTAEQLLDAQSRTLGVPVPFNGHPMGIRAGQLPGVRKLRRRAKAPSPGDRFLFAFGKPERLMTCECERSDSTTLSQALLLLSGECTNGLLTDDQNLITRLLRSDMNLNEMITELYWSALSRAPAPREVNAAHSTLAHGESTRQGLEDICWALINAKEFVFRQ